MASGSYARGRLFITESLNHNVCHEYLSSLLWDQKRSEEYYNPTAFLRDSLNQEVFLTTLEILTDMPFELEFLDLNQLNLKTYWQYVPLSPVPSVEVEVILVQQIKEAASGAPQASSSEAAEPNQLVPVVDVVTLMPASPQILASHPLIAQLKDCMSEAANRESKVIYGDSANDICSAFEELLYHQFIDESAFWTLRTPWTWIEERFPFVLPYMGEGALVLSPIHTLTRVTTPIGFLRAFVRMTLNQQKCHHYFSALFSDKAIHSYYRPNALLYDEDYRNVIKGLFKELDAIQFSITIDNYELDFPTLYQLKKEATTISISTDQVSQSSTPDGSTLVPALSSSTSSKRPRERKKRFRQIEIEETVAGTLVAVDIQEFSKVQQAEVAAAKVSENSSRQSLQEDNPEVTTEIPNEVEEATPRDRLSEDWQVMDLENDETITETESVATQTPNIVPQEDPLPVERTEPDMEQNETTVDELSPASNEIGHVEIQTEALSDNANDNNSVPNVKDEISKDAPEENITEENITEDVSPAPLPAQTFSNEFSPPNSYDSPLREQEYSNEDFLSLLTNFTLPPELTTTTEPQDSGHNEVSEETPGIKEVGEDNFLPPHQNLFTEDEKESSSEEAVKPRIVPKTWLWDDEDLENRDTNPSRKDEDSELVDRRESIEKAIVAEDTLFDSPLNLEENTEHETKSNTYLLSYSSSSSSESHDNLESKLEIDNIHDDLPIEDRDEVTNNVVDVNEELPLSATLTATHSASLWEDSSDDQYSLIIGSLGSNEYSKQVEKQELQNQQQETQQLSNLQQIDKTSKRTSADVDLKEAELALRSIPSFLFTQMVFSGGEEELPEDEEEIEDNNEEMHNGETPTIPRGASEPPSEEDLFPTNDKEPRITEEEDDEEENSSILSDNKQGASLSPSATHHSNGSQKSKSEPFAEFSSSSLSPPFSLSRSTSPQKTLFSSSSNDNVRDDNNKNNLDKYKDDEQDSILASRKRQFLYSSYDNVPETNNDNLLRKNLSQSYNNTNNKYNNTDNSYNNSNARDIASRDSSLPSHRLFPSDNSSANPTQDSSPSFRNLIGMRRDSISSPSSTSSFSRTKGSEATPRTPSSFSSRSEMSSPSSDEVLSILLGMGGDQSPRRRSRSSSVTTGFWDVRTDASELATTPEDEKKKDINLSAFIIEDYEPTNKLLIISDQELCPLFSKACEELPDFEKKKNWESMSEEISDIYDLNVYTKKPSKDKICFNCNSPLTASLFSEYGLFCNYTGKHYCTACHSKQTSVIPARVVTWDFTPLPVCNSAYEHIQKHWKSPLFNIVSLNPSLYREVPDLNKLMRIRSQATHIATFLRSCKTGLSLFQPISNVMYLIDSMHTYSGNDLVAVNNGRLLSILTDYLNKCLYHITVTCESCKGKGDFCELCKSTRPIFRFQFVHITICPACSSAFHSTCAVQYSLGKSKEVPNPGCPKCRRIWKIQHSK